MDISLIKKHLQALTTGTEKPFLILSDMTGPVARANGHNIESRSREIKAGWDEQQVAEAIYKDVDWIAFYEVVESPESVRLRAASGMLWEIGLGEPPAPLNIAQIKQHLQDNDFATKKNFVILSDLTGPVGLANGHPITAVSHAIPRTWTDRQVAESIHAQAEWVAFYKTMDIPSHSHTHVRLAFGKLSEIGL